ncbi:MAG: hypothetical protein ABIS50_26270 [Luteolibacter sp.]|uniref:hypothetical protein n=1 Tax=Luteolibacter sp. TaxID=1962973 RepID=UPI0032661BF2
MSPDSIPQISLGTAALTIFAVCAGFVMLRGMTRMIIGTVALSLSAWLGFRVWQEAPTLSVDWMGKSVPWITNGLPLVAFLVSFFVIRKIAKSIFSPHRKDHEPAKPRSIIRTAFLLLLALIPTSLLCLIGATFIHHNGSIAEVRAFSEKSSGSQDTIPDGFSQRLKASIEDALPESWIKNLDPLTQPSRLTLAKLIAAQSESPLVPVINPQTGKPIPRAIIVDDPDLQNLAREGKFSTLLRHPLLTKALADPKIQKLLRDLNL